MLDSHVYPPDWGIRPVLFNILNLGIPSYSVFVLLGLVAGIAVYCIESKRARQFNEKAFYIFFAALFFGTLGAKLPIWIVNYKLIVSSFPDISPFLSGRTIVGGLIGGTIGVVLTKRFLKINVRMGNQIAPAAAIGIAIGRIGCYLRGCCYGIATSLPWGVNFGDGVSRHPTQIYEALYDFAVFLFLISIRNKVATPGRLFEIFLNLYFVFRFFIEFIRVEEIIFMGLTGFQIASVLALLYINRSFIKGVLTGVGVKA
jgi:phosphatidylglycerol---prolipoprotein diacylglyceryl transferase